MANALPIDFPFMLLTEIGFVQDAGDGDLAHYFTAESCFNAVDVPNGVIEATGATVRDVEAALAAMSEAGLTLAADVGPADGLPSRTTIYSVTEAGRTAGLAYEEETEYGERKLSEPFAVVWRHHADNVRPADVCDRQ